MTVEQQYHILPPQEVQFHNPLTNGLLQTPLTSTGLVHTDRLVQQVKATVSPDYDWPSPLNNTHHTYWPRHTYSYEPDNVYNPRDFRSSAGNCIVIQSVFHNWIHRVTEPPPVPPRDVMYQYMDAEQTIEGLCSIISYGESLPGASHLTAQQRESKLARNFCSLVAKLDYFKSLPQEFTRGDLAHIELQDRNDITLLKAELGKLAAAQDYTAFIAAPIQL